MNWRLLCGAALLCVVVAIAIGQRNIIHERGRNQALQAELTHEMVSPRVDTSAGPGIRHADAGEPQDPARDLPRLRNEVRQLRERKADLERLRAEHDRLQQQLNEAAAQVKVSEPTPEQGFLMNATWAYAGFGTPEATLQSFFCAIRDKNVPNLLACLTPESAENVREGIMDEVRAMGRLKGYRLVTIDATDDAVNAKLQAAVNGITADLSLRRIGAEWRLDLMR